MILEDESNENSGDFNELTSGPAVTLSQELFSSLVKYGSASLSSETQVKQETERKRSIQLFLKVMKTMSERLMTEDPAKKTKQ